MKIFQNKLFANFARKQKISDADLCKAVDGGKLRRSYAVEAAIVISSEAENPKPRASGDDARAGTWM